MHKNLPRTIYLVIVMLVSVCLTSFSWAPQARTNTKLTRGAASASALLARNAARIGGCTVFPANNIWNYDISNLPVAANSAQYINSMGLSGQLRSYFGATDPGYAPQGMPYATVPTTQPYVPLQFYYQSDPGPYPIPPHVPIEGGRNNYNSNNDRHVLVVDQGTCKLYEMWRAFPLANGGWYAGSGAVWDLASNHLRPLNWTSADAAGLPILPGLARYSEDAAGVIAHALRVTTTSSQCTFLWPARHYASTNCDPNLPPMGLRLRLKASVDISSFPPDIQVILTALKHYGMFVADNGPRSWVLSGAPDPRWNNNDLALLGNITGSDFEAVDESALQLYPNSGAVNPAYLRAASIQQGSGQQSALPALFSRLISPLSALDLWHRRLYRHG
mgnify:CR=1 FL=1